MGVGVRKGWGEGGGQERVGREGGVGAGSMESRTSRHAEPGLIPRTGWAPTKGSTNLWNQIGSVGGGGRRK